MRVGKNLDGDCAARRERHMNRCRALCTRPEMQRAQEGWRVAQTASPQVRLHGHVVLPRNECARDHLGNRRCDQPRVTAVLDQHSAMVCALLADELIAFCKRQAKVRRKVVQRIERGIAPGGQSDVTSARSNGVQTLPLDFSMSAIEAHGLRVLLVP